MEKVSGEKKPPRFWKALAPDLVKKMDSELDLGDRNSEEVVKQDLPQHHLNQSLEGIIGGMTTLENSTLVYLKGTFEPFQHQTKGILGLTD